MPAILFVELRIFFGGGLVEVGRLGVERRVEMVSAYRQPGSSHARRADEALHVDARAAGGRLDETSQVVRRELVWDVLLRELPHDHVAPRRRVGVVHCTTPPARPKGTQAQITPRASQNNRRLREIA